MNTETPLTFAVTTSVPAGVSSGSTFGTLAEAMAAFRDSAKGTYPNGTTVTLYANDLVLDTATVTEETKAAERAVQSASLDAIVAKANARAAARLRG